MNALGGAVPIRAIVYWVDAFHRVVKMAHPGRAGHYYALQMKAERPMAMTP